MLFPKLTKEKSKKIELRHKNGNKYESTGWFGTKLVTNKGRIESSIKWI